MIYLPAWLFLSLIMAAFYGALFHLLWGQTAIGLLRVLLIAVVSFLVGEAGARVAGSNALMVGDVHAGIASLTAWAALAIDRWRTLES